MTRRTPARDEPLFPPGAVIRRVDGEAVLLLGGGRALLLQLAHPSSPAAWPSTATSGATRSAARAVLYPRVPGRLRRVA